MDAPQPVARGASGHQGEARTRVRGSMGPFPGPLLPPAHLSQAVTHRPASQGWAFLIERKRKEVLMALESGALKMGINTKTGLRGETQVSRKGGRGAPKTVQMVGVLFRMSSHKKKGRIKGNFSYQVSFLHVFIQG